MARRIRDAALALVVTALVVAAGAGPALAQKQTVVVYTAIENEQIARLRVYRTERDEARTQAKLVEIRRVAESEENLMPSFIDALDSGATIGEICDVLRSAFGIYRGEAVA